MNQKLAIALCFAAGLSANAVFAENAVTKWLNEPSKFAKDRLDSEYLECKLDIARENKGMDKLLKLQPQYEYHFYCTAKQNVVMRDLRILMEEVVESRNTHVGKKERSRRDLDSVKPVGEQEVKISAGKKFKQRGILTVPHHAINKSGRHFIVTARLNYPDEAKKIDVNADRDKNPTKYLLKLEVQKH